MEHRAPTLNRLFGVLLASYVTFAAPALASDVDALLDQLQTADAAEAQRIQGEITERWSRSGSAAFDYLLRRGRAAMDDRNFHAAIDHLTALTDHAPDFAEGWSTRATAFFLDGQFGPAIHDIEQALALNPRHFGALAGLGVMLEQMGQPLDALRAYEAAIAIHPNMLEVNQAVERLRARHGTTL